MPCISGPYNPTVGPLIQVCIASPETFEAAKKGDQSQQPIGFCMALIDTGASSTCISQKLAVAQKIMPTGKMPVAGVHGSSPMNTYQFGIGFMTVQKQDPTGQISGDLHWFPASGMEFNNDGCGFDVLLGRDVICKGTLMLSFDGRFLFCW